MSKAIFKYPMNATIKIPGYNEAPGEIKARIEHAEGPPEYFVVGKPGPRPSPSNYFTEGQLSEANPPPPEGNVSLGIPGDSGVC